MLDLLTKYFIIIWASITFRETVYIRDSITKTVYTRILRKDFDIFEDNVNLYVWHKKNKINLSTDGTTEIYVNDSPEAARAFTDMYGHKNVNRPKDRWLYTSASLRLEANLKRQDL